MRIVLFAGASRLGCSTVQVTFWPEYEEDNKCTELRVETKPPARSSVSDWELMLVSLSPACQVIVATGETLSTEQSTSTCSAPSFHLALELMVMFGRAAWEKGGKKPQEVRVFLSSKRLNLQYAHTAKYVGRAD